MIGLTSLITEYPPMPPKFNRRRAVFVLGKSDEILAWERRKETERDTKFVELARYLCEVRAGQYWRLESLKVFRRVSGERLTPLSGRRSGEKLALSMSILACCETQHSANRTVDTVVLQCPMESVVPV